MHLLVFAFGIAVLTTIGVAWWWYPILAVILIFHLINGDELFEHGTPVRHSHPAAGHNRDDFKGNSNG